MTWRIHVPGRDPSLDEIVTRRLGRMYSRRCENPDMLLCASWGCQYRDRCKLDRSSPSSSRDLKAG